MLILIKTRRVLFLSPGVRCREWEWAHVVEALWRRMRPGQRQRWPYSQEGDSLCRWSGAIEPNHPPPSPGSGLCWTSFARSHTHWHGPLEDRPRPLAWTTWGSALPTCKSILRTRQLAFLKEVLSHCFSKLKEENSNTKSLTPRECWVRNCCVTWQDSEIQCSLSVKGIIILWLHRIFSRKKKKFTV